MCFKIGVLRNFAIFTKKHLCWSLILINLQVLRPTTLFKRDFVAGVSCEYCEFLRIRTAFFMEHSGCCFSKFDKVVVSCGHYLPIFSS